MSKEILEKYFNCYEEFNKTIGYLFELHGGGIGDFLKFYVATLNYCITNNAKFYLEDKTIMSKFIKQKNNKTFNCENLIVASELSMIKKSNCVLVKPQAWHHTGHIVWNAIYKYKLEDIFYFSDDVVSKANEITKGEKYIAFHLRLGDSHLETDKKYVTHKHDERLYDEKTINAFIKKYEGENAYFICDNISYKNRTIKRNSYLKSTNLSIAHTSLMNTKEQDFFNSIVEFYILAHAEHIFACSNWSGFSTMASRFKGTKITNLNKLPTKKIKMI